MNGVGFSYSGIANNFFKIVFHFVLATISSPYVNLFPVQSIHILFIHQQAMATASSLLLQGPILKLENHLHHSPRSPTRPSNANFRIPIISFKRLSVKCSLPNNNDSVDDQDINRRFGFAVNMETQQNHFEFVAKSTINALKALKKPAAAAVLVGLLLMYDPNSALAAGSGGRMGGSSFSSRSSLSSSSRSYSTPRSEASSSGSYRAPRSEASSSGSYSAPRSEASSPGSYSALWSVLEAGSGSSSYSRSTKSSSSRSYSAPRSEPEVESGFSYSVYEPSPLGGVSLGPAVGVESGAFLILIAFVAFVLVSGFLSEGSKSSSVLTATKKTTVLKVQVGLLGLGRSLQKDLNRIAETADTSTSEGLHYVLTETVLALLRHPDYCISTYSSVDIKKSMDEGEKRFNQLSIEERGKFDEETLVNVNNIKKQSSTHLRASGFSNEYIVITMLVAAEGVHKLPSINNSKDLKETLQKLASIPSSRILAVEVLWTPQNEDDTLSERELLEDYPLLRPL